MPVCIEKCVDFELSKNQLVLQVLSALLPFVSFPQTSLTPTIVRHVFSKLTMFMTSLRQTYENFVPFFFQKFFQ